MTWCYVVNVPGYLPNDTEPPEQYPTREEAAAAAAEEIGYRSDRVVVSRLPGWRDILIGGDPVYFVDEVDGTMYAVEVMECDPGVGGDA